MYARLWWKEARTFWPIVAALGGVALLVQNLFLWLRISPADLEAGLLIPLAMAWAVLHAFAVGAAALAGERETNTLLLLDVLPIGRRRIWMGKVTYALVSTLVLALALFVMGFSATTQYNRNAYPLSLQVVGLGTLLIEALGWSLLWSALLGSALNAALAGLLTVGTIEQLLTHYGSEWSLLALTTAIGPRLLLAGGAYLASWVIFTRPVRPDRAVAVRGARENIVEPRRAHTVHLARLRYPTAGLAVRAPVAPVVAHRGGGVAGNDVAG